MRIGFSSIQSNYVKFTKIENDNEQPKEMLVADKPEIIKQALREMAQRHIAEIQEARTDMGEDDPKSQDLIAKFKSGKKLTQEEMNYLRRNAPGMVDYIDRIQKERNMIDLSMRMAPTKMDVQLVALRSLKQIEKCPNPEEREIMAKQLADVKYNYEISKEYKEKPDGPLDKEDKKSKLKKIIYNPKQPTQVAIEIYEKKRMYSSKIDGGNYYI